HKSVLMSQRPLLASRQRAPGWSGWRGGSSTAHGVRATWSSFSTRRVPPPSSSSSTPSAPLLRPTSSIARTSPTTGRRYSRWSRRRERSSDHENTDLPRAGFSSRCLEQRVSFERQSKRSHHAPRRRSLAPGGAGEGSGDHICTGGLRGAWEDDRGG